MVDKLTRYEVKLLNKVIPKTTESISFNVFDILKDLSEQTSYFDRGHYIYSDQDAERITNFLLDKKFVTKAYPNNLAFYRVIKWTTDKGIQLKKRNNYYVYKIRDEIMPDTGKVFIWVIGLGAVISLVYGMIIYFSRTK